MKRNSIFEQCVAEIPADIKEEVSLNVDIANRICDMLKKRNMTQREFAALMGKRESEISRWLTGSRGFTTTTLAKISSVLGEPVVEVKRERRQMYPYAMLVDSYALPEQSKGEFKGKRGNGIVFISKLNYGRKAKNSNVA